jgi:hypothetical protein
MIYLVMTSLISSLTVAFAWMVSASYGRGERQIYSPADCGGYSHCPRLDGPIAAFDRTQAERWAELDPARRRGGDVRKRPGAVDGEGRYTILRGMTDTEARVSVLLSSSSVVQHLYLQDAKPKS